MPKTIVITGTATGMGRATIGKFAAEGWNVVATVRKEPDLKAHAGLRCVKTVLLDVDDETAAVPFARLALEQFRRGGCPGEQRRLLPAMLTATEIAGFVGAGLAGAAYIPQISHLIRARCSAGITGWHLRYGSWRP